jgi:uncharacterized protein (DUF433 family)
MSVPPVYMGIHRITHSPGVQGGRAHVLGTRIPVASVVLAERGSGGVDSVRAAYPQLSAEDVADALAYCVEHRAEVDAFIAGLTVGSLIDDANGVA